MSNFKNSSVWRESALKNLSWFRQSPIMDGDGRWGVGERLVLTAGNDALAKIHERFPETTCHPGGVECLEQRRSDCNFEAALLFLLAGKLLDSTEFRQVARNLLDYLYCRSGLLNRMDNGLLYGGWAWNHTRHDGLTLWMDDNGWVCAIQFLLARLAPELDAQYRFVHGASILAAELHKVFARSFKPETGGQLVDPEHLFNGRLELPHWAVPVQCALALYLETLLEEGDEAAAVRAALRRYQDYILPQVATTNSSELGYLMILAGTLMQTREFAAAGEELAAAVAAQLEARIAANPYGILPAEHFEAPAGPNLADLIYTINFAFVGLALAARKNARYRPTAEKLGAFLAAVQDDGEEYPALKGCWRGMYDCQAHRYGGGNLYEGGANSIYSGWTNAPIAIGMLLMM